MVTIFVKLVLPPCSIIIIAIIVIGRIVINWNALRKAHISANFG